MSAMNRMESQKLNGPSKRTAFHGCGHFACIAHCHYDDRYEIVESWCYEPSFHLGTVPVALLNGEGR